MTETSKRAAWPDLSRLDLVPTVEALHLWCQVIGKIRLMTTPWMNHSWHVPLYVSVRGLSTGLMPAGDRSFTIEVDLVGDVVTLLDTDGDVQVVPLRPQSVATFYAAVVRALRAMSIHLRVDAMPCELPGAVLFHQDEVVRPYDGDVARAYWHALVQVQRVLELFRTRFVGKCSPVHLFWGSFDLAVTRFSGRSAPRHPGGAPNMPDAVARDAYSREVSSAGFWPGGGAVPGPSFYSYAYPAPPGYADAGVRPAAARFDPALGEFLLSYDAVRASVDPEAALLDFLQSTYEAAAERGAWDRAALEGPTGPVGHPAEGA